MGNSYFISDVHFGTRHSKSEKIKENSLLSFFDHVGQFGDRFLDARFPEERTKREYPL